MIPPEKWEKTIDGRHYSTLSSVLIARGSDIPKSPHGELDWNLFLYRTKEGCYFKIDLTPSRRRPEILEPLTPVEALKLFGTLAERCVDLEDAFPLPVQPVQTIEE